MLPSFIHDFFRVHFLKNAVASQKNEVFLPIESVFAYLGVSPNAVFDPSQFWILGLDISKSAGDRQLPWEYSEWADDRISRI